MCDSSLLIGLLKPSIFAICFFIFLAAFGTNDASQKPLQGPCVARLRNVAGVLEPFSAGAAFSNSEARRLGIGDRINLTSIRGNQRQLLVIGGNENFLHIMESCGFKKASGGFMIAGTKIAIQFENHYREILPLLRSREAFMILEKQRYDVLCLSRTHSMP